MTHYYVSNKSDLFAPRGYMVDNYNIFRYNFTLSTWELIYANSSYLKSKTEEVTEEEFDTWLMLQELKR